MEDDLDYDPVEEVYRIREELMERCDWDMKKYNAYVDSLMPEFVAMGFKAGSPRAQRLAASGAV